MSNRHIDAAWRVRLPGRQKLVLLALADHACDECGLAWPGIPRLAARTGIGATTLREDLQALTDAGLLEIRRYPRGGRGRATEYVVLGALVPVAATVCLTCARNLAGSRAAESHQAGDGFRPGSGTDTHHPGGVNGATKPTTRVMGNGVGNGRVVHKPTAASPKTHHPGGDQPSREPEPSARAHPHARERQAVAATPRARNRPPTQPASVGDALRSLMPGLAVSGALNAIPVDQAVAATAADRGEPQGPRQRGAGAGARHGPGSPTPPAEAGDTLAWAAGSPEREGRS